MEQKNKLFESLIMRLRKRVGCAAFLILSLSQFIILPLGAQTAEDADRAYKELIEMRMDTAVSKDTFYAKVLECSRIQRSVLIASPMGVAAYAKAQSTLKSLYPFIRSGAGYYSQARRDSLALIYAKMAVDIAIMQEMRDQGLRTMPDYPNFVYFVASRTYNAGQNDPQQYVEAIKYLKEYMDVTDVSQHPRVLAYLKEAEHLAAQMQRSKTTFQDVRKGVPDFDIFARESIIQGMEKWKQKDPYETVAEYKDRVNEKTARAKQQELQHVLMDEYIQRFAHKMSVSDMQLKPYDADNQSFLIGCPYGDIVLIVPRTDNEARDFAESWSDIKVYNQNFVIADKKLALAGLTFSTPSGKTYTYSNQQAIMKRMLIPISKTLSTTANWSIQRVARLPRLRLAVRRWLSAYLMLILTSLSPSEQTTRPLLSSSLMRSTPSCLKYLWQVTMVPFSPSIVNRLSACPKRTSCSILMLLMAR